MPSNKRPGCWLPPRDQNPLGHLVNQQVIDLIDLLAPSNPLQSPSLAPKLALDRHAPQATALHFTERSAVLSNMDNAGTEGDRRSALKPGSTTTGVTDRFLPHRA